MISREQLNEDYYIAMSEFDKLPAREQAQRNSNILLMQVREALLDVRDLLVSIDRRIDP